MRIAFNRESRVVETARLFCYGLARERRVRVERRLVQNSRDFVRDAD